MWAKLRLEMYDITVLLLRSFFVTAQVVNPLAKGTVIGSETFILKFSQKSAYNFQAGVCLAQVCFEAE